jgi:hypothetical protein
LSTHYNSQSCKAVGVYKLVDVDIGYDRLNPVFWLECFRIAGVLVCSRS